MYTPAHFAEDRTDVLHEFIRSHPLATLISAGANGPEVSVLPMFLDAQSGALRCHLAKANPQLRALGGQNVLALFQGPAHYISPAWYPAKQEHGKVVPTWNYIAVEVRGTATLKEDRNWLVSHVSELTTQQESGFDSPWHVTDAPADYIDGLTRAIVGVMIEIRTITGKWKLNQNRSRADQRGVVSGLTELGSPQSLELAASMRTDES